MRIVIGLGNPGSRYEGTRHNVGWMVLDRLADRAGIGGRTKARDAAATVRGRYEELDLLLVKPMTYMNLSGEAVRKVLARERVPLDETLVVVDDIALPLGRLRLRDEGSAGGHNGLRSIIAEMGTQRFARLRVGIGAPERGMVDHVLGRFQPDEEERLRRVLDAATDAVLDWARHGSGRAANRWNAWELPADSVDPAGAAGIDAPASAGRSTTSDAGGRVTGPDGIVRTSTGWRKPLGGREHRHDG